jgi:hypothetical protein
VQEAIHVRLLLLTHPAPGLCQESGDTYWREVGHVGKRVIPLVLQQQGQIAPAVAPDAPFGKLSGVDPYGHRLRRHSNFPRNLQLGLALAVSLHDRHVALVACLSATQAPAPFPGRLLQAGPSTLAKFRPSSYLKLSDVLFHRLAEVVNQVVSIIDLDGGRSAQTAAFGVKTTSIPGDDFYARVRPQPFREALGRSNRQQVDHPVSLQVHEDRAV